MAITAALKTFSDPESLRRDMTREERTEIYAQSWSYYRNEIFSRRVGRDWSVYLDQRDLYKHTRLIYNPVPMIVDFYVDNIWRPVPNKQFESLATPASPTTDEKLLAAIAQLDQWGNFLAEAQKIKRYAAAAGNVLVEGIDDLDRQKILHNTVWPGYVTQIELNSTGDVQSYTIEYEVYDPDRKANYRYRKSVTKEKFAYFRDDHPFTPPGKRAEVEPNPYGFCFAVWLRHTDDGFDYGQPACMHLDKVDECNALGSHLHDHIHKAIESPKVISTDGEIKPIVGGTQDPKTGIITPHDPRLNWVVFKTNRSASVFDLAGSLALAEAHPYLKELLASFADDYPELQARTVIKENSQLSGAALERMLTPAQNRLDGVQASYNQQLVKLRQMQVAVGGMRASSGGGWSSGSKQRDLFKPFALQSYQKGDLDFNLVSSMLITPTDAENEDLLMKKATRGVELETLVGEREALAVAGYSEDRITEILAEKKTENSIETEEPPVPPPAAQ